MTTIVVRDNVMVSDGQMSRGDFIDSYDFPKIVDINGCLVGCAGSVPSILKFRQWFSDNMEAELAKQDYPFVNITLPEDMVEDDFTALVLYPDGVLYEFFGAQNAMEVKQPAAIGSGMFYALSALDAGVSAEEAVKIATYRDPFSGGDLQIHTLGEEEPLLTREDLEGMEKEEILQKLFGEEEGGCVSENIEILRLDEYSLKSDGSFLEDGKLLFNTKNTVEQVAENFFDAQSVKIIASKFDISYHPTATRKQVSKLLLEHLKDIVDSSETE